jgi:aerobic-type carbon monoxide dehydrogenase small subunit (CoxS/CutS family)
MQAKIEMIINMEKIVLNVEPNWTLRYVLHDILGLISIKDMCGGKGECGSCTVIVDKRPVLSCMMLALDCDGSEIETIEDIVKKNHPLIDEYVRFNCMQCGYCTSGFIVTAKALLDKNPYPNENDVKEALAGNICRCGTYPQHIKAVLAAARSMEQGEKL